MKKLCIFLNGTGPNLAPDLSKYNYIVCSDGAYHYLLNLGIKPDIIMGDFDSLISRPIDIPCLELPDQNYTDFEKILMHFLNSEYKEIDIFGSSGKEHDHFIGNLSIAKKYINEFNIKFHDDLQEYFIINKSIKLRNMLNKMISIIPFPLAQNITYKGLEYNLLNEDLELGIRIGTRNKAVLEEIEINFSAGTLIIFIERIK